MNSTSVEPQRWNNYFLKRGSDFDKFWDSYLNIKTHDLLFVIGLGFDPRMCNALASILAAGGAGKRDCFLLELKEGELEKPNAQLLSVEGNEKKLSNLLEKRGSVIRKEMNLVDSDGRRIGSRCYHSIFSEEDLLHYSDIIVDISALPRVLYFQIINELLTRFDSHEKSKFNIHIVVSESPILDVNIEPIGVEEKASYIKGFGTDYEHTAQLPKVWMPIIGEGREEQLRRIHTLIHPKEICPLIPSPSYDPRRGDRLFVEYGDTLFDGFGVVPTDIIYVSEQNPFEVYRQIIKTALSYDDSLKIVGGCKIILSALSSKLLSMGALLACYELRRNGKDVLLAQVEANNYRFEESSVHKEERIGELFHLWLAGDCYDTQ